MALRTLDNVCVLHRRGRAGCMLPLSRPGRPWQHRSKRRRATMRWCVSIGAALVAGALVGGDVAGVAAPNAKFAQKAPEAQVDVELVLAVDVSYSMDLEELAIQREGYAQAVI